MKKHIMAIVLAMSMTAFAFPKKGEYTLKGEIGNINTPAKARLSYPTATKYFIDTTTIQNGRFEFKGTINDPVKASLVIIYKGTGVGSKSAEELRLYLEDGIIKVSSPDSLKNAKITESKINEDYENYKIAMEPSDLKKKALMNEFHVLPAEKKKDEEVKASFIKRGNTIHDEKGAATLAFIKENPESFISLVAIKAYGGSSPEYSKVLHMFNLLSADIRNTDSGKEYAASLEILRATQIGKIAPDFTQNDPDGNQVKLSDFRGKYVLIDFWASWCGPCRAENPNLVKAYTHYKDKNFTILGVSLDQEKTKQKWIDAIKKDGLTWTHVSDLKFWDNAVAKLYGIRAVPQNVLIDPRGKIIAKNLRGKALQDKLAEIFK